MNIFCSFWKFRHLFSSQENQITFNKKNIHLFHVIAEKPLYFIERLILPLELRSTLFQLIYMKIYLQVEIVWRQLKWRKIANFLFEWNITEMCWRELIQKFGQFSGFYILLIELLYIGQMKSVWNCWFPERSKFRVFEAKKRHPDWNYWFNHKIPKCKQPEAVLRSRFHIALLHNCSGYVQIDAFRVNVNVLEMTVFDHEHEHEIDR